MGTTFTFICSSGCPCYYSQSQQLTSLPLFLSEVEVATAAVTYISHRTRWNSSPSSRRLFSPFWKLSWIVFTHNRLQNWLTVIQLSLLQSSLHYIVPEEHSINVAPGLESRWRGSIKFLGDTPAPFPRIPVDRFHLLHNLRDTFRVCYRDYRPAAIRNETRTLTPSSDF